MRNVCAVLVVVGVISAGRAQDAKSDLDKLQGTWKRSSQFVDGQKISTEVSGKVTLTLAGDQYTLTTPDGTRTGTFKLDATKTPRQLDIVPGSGPNKGKSLHAIYEIKGDTLRYCVAAPGKDRPTAFEAATGSGQSLYVYVR